MRKRRSTESKRNGADPRFEIQSSLATIGGAGSRHVYAPKSHVFRQGDPADAVFYAISGKIHITVISKQGKEAVIAMLGARDFFGYEFLAGQALRAANAIADVESTVLRVDKKTMIRALKELPAVSETFMVYLLSHKIQLEAELLDQLFNSVEKRLARALLLLANLGANGKMQTVSPKINQDVLAGRVGTTRSRINFFMNKFRRLGFIEYDHKSTLKVHASLLDVFVND